MVFCCICCSTSEEKNKAIRVWDVDRFYFDKDGNIRQGNIVYNREEELKRIHDAEDAQEEDGKIWCIIDTSWLNTWLTYVHTNKNINPRPSACRNDNLLSKQSSHRRRLPKNDLVMASADRKGHYRRISVECWNIFCEYYPGSGPKITVAFVENLRQKITGKYDTSMWVIEDDRINNSENVQNTQSAIPKFLTKSVLSNKADSLVVSTPKSSVAKSAHNSTTSTTADFSLTSELLTSEERFNERNVSNDIQNEIYVPPVLYEDIKVSKDDSTTDTDRTERADRGQGNTKKALETFSAANITAPTGKIQNSISIVGEVTPVTDTAVFSAVDAPTLTTHKHDISPSDQNGSSVSSVSSVSSASASISNADTKAINHAVGASHVDEKEGNNLPTASTSSSTTIPQVTYTSSEIDTLHQNNRISKHATQVPVRITPKPAWVIKCYDSNTSFRTYINVCEHDLIPLRKTSNDDETTSPADLYSVLPQIQLYCPDNSLLKVVGTFTESYFALTVVVNPHITSVSETEVIKEKVSDIIIQIVREFLNKTQNKNEINLKSDFKLMDTSVVRYKGKVIADMEAAWDHVKYHFLDTSIIPNSPQSEGGSSAHSDSSLTSSHNKRRPSSHHGGWGKNLFRFTSSDTNKSLSASTSLAAPLIDDSDHYS